MSSYKKFLILATLFLGFIGCRDSGSIEKMESSVPIAGTSSQNANSGDKPTSNIPEAVPVAISPPALPSPLILPPPLPLPIPVIIGRGSAWGDRKNDGHSDEVCEDECAKDSDCEDDDPCTVDTCKDATCVNTPVAGCASCDMDSDCQPGLRCPSPTCSDHICTYPAAPDCASLISIRVSPVALTIPVGAFQKFVAIGHFSDDSDLEITELAHWLSSKTAVATVFDTAGSKGLAKGISPGGTTITATFEG